MTTRPAAAPQAGEYPATITDPHAAAGPGWMTGRTALVTGGGLGGPAGSLGYAISLLFARHGAQVAVMDRDADAAKQTVDAIEQAGGDAVAVIGDATGEADCQQAAQAAADRFGRLDTLVNNVASGDRSLLYDVTPERFDELMDASLKSAWLMTRAALPALRDGGGAIVNISSVAVQLAAPMVYSLAKAGVENMTRGSAAQLAADGVRVNCVQVGGIWSAMAERNIPPDQREARRRMVALQTEGTVWDPAYAALFLASDRARWVSGHILTVDGGGYRRGPQRPEPPQAPPPPDGAIGGGRT